HFLRDVLQGGERKVPGLGGVMEVAVGANLGPQVHDRDMGRVFVAGVDDETEAEIVLATQPSGFQVVFGSLDRGVVEAGELAADVGEEILAYLFFGYAPVTRAEDVE